MSVPGTFKGRPPAAARRREPDAIAIEQLLISQGATAAEVWTVGECGVIVAREPTGNGSYVWHLSVSHRSRYPSWDEIKTAVYATGAADRLDPGRTFAQILGHVEDGDWVDIDENCFHLYEIADPL